MTFSDTLRFSILSMDSYAGGRRLAIAVAVASATAGSFLPAT
jgi:hypothetical protein